MIRTLGTRAALDRARSHASLTLAIARAVGRTIGTLIAELAIRALERPPPRRE